MRRPIRRAGITKTGSRISASNVICQLIAIMTPSVRVRVTMLDTTPDKVSLNARWAPMTSLLSRLTRAPVRVRVKNAIGIRCTWSKTARRRSRMRPSPMFADSHRTPIPAAASATAISAMATASPTIIISEPLSVMRLTTRPAISGVTTVSTAVKTDSRRNHPIRRRCGRANPPIRRSVTRRSPRNRLLLGWVEDLYIMSQATDCILMPSTVELKPNLRSSLFAAGGIAGGEHAGQATRRPSRRLAWHSSRRGVPRTWPRRRTPRPAS